MVRYQKSVCILGICFPWLFLNAQPYTLNGGVFDANRQPLGQVVVHLIYDSGLRLQTTTKANGTFRFTGLSAGMATCFAELPSDNQPISPPCGIYHFEVSDQPYLGFDTTNQTTGVVVTFGSPIGNSPELPVTGGMEQVQLAIWGLENYSQNLVDEIVISGYWQIFSIGSVATTGVGASITPLPGFSTFDFNVIDLPQNRVKYTIAGSALNPIIQNGPMALIDLEFPQSNLYQEPFIQNPIQFCIESLLIYSGESLIDSHFNHTWLGKITTQ